jgi:sugar O-acyltransferase (sialic acid O-acetyltransferase NeuD family)
MQQSKKILLLGAGGHCQSVADSLIDLETYDVISLVGKPEAGLGILDEKPLCGLTIVGNDEQLEQLFREGYKAAFLAMGSIGDTKVRRSLYTKLKKIGFELPNIIDRSSVVSRRAFLGEGNYIGKNATVNAYTEIGNCSIINTGSVVEHQCRIGDFAHIASGSILCGDVTIGADTHIGAGTVIKQGIKIGCGTMIGMGSIVLKDIEDHVTAYGNPCRRI